MDNNNNNNYRLINACFSEDSVLVCVHLFFSMNISTFKEILHRLSLQVPYPADQESMLMLETELRQEKEEKKQAMEESKKDVSSLREKLGNYST